VVKPYTWLPLLLNLGCGADDPSKKSGSTPAAESTTAANWPGTDRASSAEIGETNAAGSGGEQQNGGTPSLQTEGAADDESAGSSASRAAQPSFQDTSSEDPTAQNETLDSPEPAVAANPDPGAQSPGETDLEGTPDPGPGELRGAASDPQEGDQTETAPPGTPLEEELSSVPSPRSEHGVGALNGEVYVVGGFTPQVTDTVYAYNPELDTWRDVASFPVVAHHPNVASVGARLYVLGFHTGSGQRMGDGSSYAYDPMADSWSSLAPMPIGTERGASCTATHQDKIYIFGGTNDVALADASVYDPAGDTWTVLAPMPVARHHCIAAEWNDKIYIVSGRDVVIEEVQTASLVFDPVSQEYNEVAPILTPRGGAAGGRLGDRIYVFGGEGDVNDPVGIFHEAEAYDPATDTWEALPDMLIPRHGLGAAVIGDRMYLPGGSTSQGLAAQDRHTVFYLEAP
jgi:N-acetylneuraminic acid mutarotase